ncbi:enoyl-CoA hydratase/isomerase family protein [Propionibacteriaceae bacterium Y1685]
MADNAPDEVQQWVRLEVVDHVATIRVDRPRMNALNAAIQARLGELALECARRDDIAAVVLTGGPDVFAAGADIKEMVDMSYGDMVRHSAALQAGFTAIAQIPKPVVAAVCGYALGGGCELALCADIRIAAEDATFGQPEIKLGVIPGAGGTQRLTRLVGPSRAKDIIFTGRFVSAEEALRIGLVDQLVPADEVIETATAWAAQFVGGAALALRAAKQAVDHGAEVDLATGLEIERQQFAALFATEDRTTGMRSFIEQGPGKATFHGR